MFDHKKMLGSLFIAWAIMQTVASVIMLVMNGIPSPSIPTLAYWSITALVIAVYLFTGIRLRAHDPRLRIPALILSALAILTFPLGTALGIYGLWALLHRPREATA